jgi:drug/metabolite transporter (DMT)-like permease
VELPAENRRRGAVLAITAAIFAAGFLIAFQAASRGGPRGAVVLAMLLGAALFNGGTALVRPRTGGRPGRVWLITVVALAAMTIAGNLGVAGALARLDAGLTSTILQTQVFVVGLGARLFLAETLTVRFLVGASIAVAGFAVLGLPDANAAAIDMTGVASALVAVASFAGMLVFTRGVIKSIDPVSVNAVRLVIAVMVLAALPGQIPALLALPADVWLQATIAAACGPFASRLCLMYALRDLGASDVKLISLLSPIFAFALAFAVYRAVPLPRELAGGALILLGVLLPNLKRGHAPPI